MKNTRVIVQKKTQVGFATTLFNIGLMGALIGLITIPIMILIPDKFLSDSSSLVMLTAFSTYSSIKWFHWLKDKWDLDPDDIPTTLILVILSIGLSLLTAVTLGILAYLFRGSKEPFID